MFDFSEVTTTQPPATEPGAFDLEAIVMIDADGITVPELWQNARRNWDRMSIEARRHISRSAQSLATKAKPPPRRRPGPAKRFTTDYAVAWGRAQGWKLIDRESYDFRTNRHHDLECGVDAMFDGGGDGRIGVQGAGVGERKAHFDKFMAWGGPDKARRRGIAVIYLEFARGNKAPLKREDWC